MGGYNIKMIDLSIIIPHFNDSKLLEKLLLSIPQDKCIQTILVDDKSEQLHVEYIKELQSKYNFEFYENDRIKSAGTCRNIGLEKAKGKWVLFADSDDYFVDAFYDTLSKYFDKDIDVVFFRPTSIYIDTGEVADRHKSFEKVLDDYVKDTSIELKIRYEIPNPVSKMIRKDFIEYHKIQFDEVRAANDMMFSTKVGHAMKKFVVSDAVIYCVTRNHGSLTANMSEEVYWSRVKVAVVYVRFLQDHLSKEEFNTIEPKLLGHFINGLRLGVVEFFKVWRYFAKNKVKWFWWSYLNPIVFVQKLQRRISDKKIKGKYYIK